MKRYLFLLVLFSLMSGCTMLKAVKLINSGEAVTNNGMESVVAFRMKEHPMLIDVRLNNSKKTYTFIFDSGALTLIRQEVAKELDVPKGVEVKAAGTGGKSKKINLTQLDRIIVGDMVVQNCAAGVTAFSHLFPDHIAGVIGSNFLKHFAVTIDYRNKKIALSLDKEATTGLNDVITMPFDVDMKSGFAPTLKCIVDGELKATAIIDTGFPGIMALPLSIAKKTEAFKRGDVTASKGSMIGGLFGMAEENYALRIDTFKIGDLKLQNIPIVTHASRGGHLLLGNKFLDKYTVTMNYPAKKIHFKPILKQFETNIPSYGLAIAKDNQKTIVSGIWNNSSAANTGIKIGNEIIKVNNDDTNTLSSIDLIEIFLDEERDTIELEIADDHGHRKATLQKQSLLPTLE